MVGYCRELPLSRGEGLVTAGGGGKKSETLRRKGDESCCWERKAIIREGSDRGDGEGVVQLAPEKGLVLVY